jgi:hypothetical protein
MGYPKALRGPRKYDFSINEEARFCMRIANHPRYFAIKYCNSSDPHIKLLGQRIAKKVGKKCLTK